MEFQLRSIPPTLRYLWMERAKLQGWPVALNACAASLQQLELASSTFVPPADGSAWAEVNHFTALTRLDLSASCFNQQHPLPARRLPHLLALSLEYVTAAAAGSLGALSTLCHLTEVVLSSMDLAALPAELSLLTSLQVLDITSNHLTTIAPLHAACPLTRRLTTLYCDLHTASFLAPAPRLTTLGLMCPASPDISLHLVALSGVLLLQQPALAQVLLASHSADTVAVCERLSAVLWVAMQASLHPPKVRSCGYSLPCSFDATNFAELSKAAMQ